MDFELFILSQRWILIPRIWIEIVIKKRFDHYISRFGDMDRLDCLCLVKCPTQIRSIAVTCVLIEYPALFNAILQQECAFCRSCRRFQQLLQKLQRRAHQADVGVV